MIKLFPHQVIAQKEFARMEKLGAGGVLSDSMGLGKTLCFAYYMKNNKIINRADLIVCPVSVMKHWKKEIKVLYSEEKTQPRVLTYHGARREEILESGRWDYVITTYSILSNDARLRTKFWGRIVLDESHYIRNGVGGGASKAARGAFALNKCSKYNWCITGTPFCNNIMDIASQCKFIGTKPYSDPKWWKNKTMDHESVQRWRKRFVLRRTKEGLLPPPYQHDISVEPTQKEKELVEILRADAYEKYIEWMEAVGTEKVRLGGYILGLIQRLRVTSNSFYCYEDGLLMIDEVMENNSKVKAMIEQLFTSIMNDSSSSVVIFSQFKKYLNVLEKVIDIELPWVNILRFDGSLSPEKRNEVIKNFTKKDGGCRVLLITLTSGGVGINLMPCSTVFLSEPWYNPFVEKQAEDRVNRLGQKNTVNVYRFSVENSVETWMQSIKKKKFYMAGGLDLIEEHEKVTKTTMEDIGELFNDFVNFKRFEDIDDE